jgi:Arc/MetJ-type ribon-helix-helix transcriptional regulator
VPREKRAIAHTQLDHLPVRKDRLCAEPTTVYTDEPSTSRTFLPDLTERLNDRRSIALGATSRPVRSMGLPSVRIYSEPRDRPRRSSVGLWRSVKPASTSRRVVAFSLNAARTAFVVTFRLDQATRDTMRRTVPHTRYGTTSSFIRESIGLLLEQEDEQPSGWSVDRRFQSRNRLLDSARVLRISTC